MLGAGASVAMGSSGAASDETTSTSSGGTGAGPSGGSGTTSTGSGTQTSPTGAGGIYGTGSPGPLAATGMWIWYVSASNGGDVPSIIATAHRHHVGTVMIKSSDGTQYWSQFNPTLVSALHAGGLHVCAWQYVYGSSPRREAKLGAAAVRKGADCLLIDAEVEYQGKYVQAQTYLRKLRRLIGEKFPVGLASFPYVDFHPSFPYSVFLGPGGAQFNVPQMYWADIGTTVNAVYAHTYAFNTPYVRQIVPLGEVSGNRPPRQIKHFRQLAHAYGAPGTSWWDWQDASWRDWRAVGATISNLTNAAPQWQMPTLARGGPGILSQGDLVVWAQEHLYRAGYHVKIDGGFGRQTQRAVESFQTAKGLPVTGQIDQSTWQALLRYRPVKVTWTPKGARPVHLARAEGLVLPVPRSATMPALGYEIPPHLGAGRPR